MAEAKRAGGGGAHGRAGEAVTAASVETEARPTPTQKAETAVGKAKSGGVTMRCVVAEGARQAKWTMVFRHRNVHPQHVANTKGNDRTGQS